MKLIPSILCAFWLLQGCSNSYYIVRHAEKAVASSDSMMSTNGDPSLSDAGKQRALALKDQLKNKRIHYIFSTPTIRTLSTAEPLRDLLGLRIGLYRTDTLEQFISTLKSIKKGNVLVVAHSNTVDDIVNALSGETKISSDLKDSEYDNLYILKRKGDRFSYTRSKYGVVSSQ